MISKTNKRIICFLAVLAAARVLFFVFKKIHSTKTADAEDNTSTAVVVVAPVDSVEDTTKFEHKDSMEIEEIRNSPSHTASNDDDDINETPTFEHNNTSFSGKLSKKRSDEERCCSPRRIGKHHFRALAASIACDEVVCTTPPSPLPPDIGRDVRRHMLKYLTDKELVAYVQASPDLHEDANNELAKRKKKWKESMLPVRVYMNKETSRITAFGDGRFDHAANLGRIRPELQSENGKGSLCLWGNKHVVFQTKFRSDNERSRLHVRNILTSESKQIVINLRQSRPYNIITTMNGHLLVIGRYLLRGQVYMMSFASPTSSGQRIVLPERPIKGMLPELSVYGVLEVNGATTLIVAGLARHRHQRIMFCESYVMKSGSHLSQKKEKWTTCAPPPLRAAHFRDSIVWNNQLVAVSSGGTSAALSGETFVYRPKTDVWLAKTCNTPDLGSKLFLNSKNHLCMEGERYSVPIRRWEVWCLADIGESNWQEMPRTYVFSTDDMRFVGTLPAKIISTMITANIEH